MTEQQKIAAEVEKIRLELPSDIRIFESDGRSVFQIKSSAGVPQGYGVYFWTEIEEKLYKYGVELNGSENIPDALRNGLKEFEKHLSEIGA